MHVTVHLKWEPSKEADLAGYKVHWGDGVTTTSMTVGREVTLTLMMPVYPMRTYRVWQSAYDVAGNESAKKLLTTVYVAG